ncbi:MAG: PP2C family protein-serine/threonine phosphatase [Acidobacteriota bacterium]|nr:MAG: PP2C family protein-serine/threonine phosphatase [Acidobacteriota bacterium]
MAGQTLLETRAFPLAGPGPGVGRALLTFCLWAASSAIVGLLVGALVSAGVVLSGGLFDIWFIQQSVLFAEAVGLSTLVGLRYAFPSMESLSPLLRYGLLLLTLAGAVFSAALLSVALRPRVLFTSLRPFLTLVAVNAVLALLVGAALIAWEQLQRTLARALEQVRVKEAFEREMELARDVQRALLPEAPPASEHLDVAFSCRPAALVGGDTLDFLELPEGRLGLSIGDVVGKGMAAALLMANLQSLVRALAAREPDPAALNRVLSQVVAGRGANRFVTFAYGVLDPSSGELHYSLAGHHPPLVAGATGVRLLEAGGLPLGVMPELDYVSGSDRLAAGETLVLYTDGVVEAPPADGSDDEFGRDRLCEIVERHHASGAQALLDAILAAVDEYSGHRPQADDTTIVVVRSRERGVTR